MFLLVNNARIAFIFFNHKENFSTINLLGSLLKQLLQQGTEISPAIRNLYAKHTKRTSQPSLDEISDLLISESRAFSKFFIVIDALDEYPTGANTKNKVISLLRRLPTLHLLVTSRPHMDLTSDLDTVRLDLRAHKRDMELFIRGRIDVEKNLARYVDKEFKETLINEIIKKSEGM